jgi:hypothetical protein
VREALTDFTALESLQKTGCEIKWVDGLTFLETLQRAQKGPTLKKFYFFRVLFSCERHRQPNFKFDMDSEVLFIYRLMPRRPDFLG